MRYHEPDLHHEGPITESLIKDLLDKIEAALFELNNFKLNGDDGRRCLIAWTETLNEAALQMCAVDAKHEFYFTDKDDNKRVDICLCILRDFEQAKQTSFLKINLN